MKKFLAYIFIAVLAIGLFSPMWSPQAQAQKLGTLQQVGTCVYYALQNNGGSVQTYVKKTTTTTSDRCATLKIGEDSIVAELSRNDPSKDYKLPPWTATGVQGGSQGCYTTDASGNKQLISTDPSFDCAGAGGTLIPLEEVRGTPTGDTLEKQLNPQQANEETGLANSQNRPECFSIATGSVGGCIVNIFYYIFYALPAFILILTARLFDAMIALTISSTLYSKSSFIPEAWKIVRDFSNIFFILMLLYIAIKMIVGLGGSETKKMIVSVIIAALLINFSLFMTQVVIDSSNILALIFYNKISVNTVKDGKPVSVDPTFDASKTGVAERDISYSIAANFNPTKLLGMKDTPNEHVFDDKKGTPISQALTPNLGDLSPPVAFYHIVQALNSSGPSVSFYLSLIFVSCLIFLFASWAFFVAAFAFFGRLIELWILIIFSPFAFMSLSVPKLKGLDFLGWDAWIQRLISIAFMAPIFMFFMLLISKLAQVSTFIENSANKTGDTTLVQWYILLIIPAIINLTLLYKATQYAKSHSGEFGKAIVKYGEMAAAAVGGLAIGAATGGVGMAAAATLGRAGSALGKSGALLRAADDPTANAFSRFGARSLLKLGNYAGGASFDARGIKVAGKTLASATGLSLGEAKQGGWQKRREERVKELQERAKSREVGEDEELKQNLNYLEQEKQGLLRDVSHDIGILDARLELWRKRAADSARAASADGKKIDENTGLSNKETNKLYQSYIQELNKHRNAIKNGETYNASADAAVAAIGAIKKEDAGKNMDYSKKAKKKITITNHDTGIKEEREVSINDLEDFIIPEAHHHIEVENRKRKVNYANLLNRPRGRFMRALRFVGTGGQYNAKAEREAVHKIIKEDEIKSDNKH